MKEVIEKIKPQRSPERESMKLAALKRTIVSQCQKKKLSCESNAIVLEKFSTWRVDFYLQGIGCYLDFISTHNGRDIRKSLILSRAAQRQGKQFYIFSEFDAMSGYSLALEEIDAIMTLGIEKK